MPLPGGAAYCHSKEKVMKRAVDERVQEFIDRLPEELIEAWQERAGIREHDAGLSRPHAEALALLDLLDGDPDVLSNLRVAQIDLNDEPRYFVSSDEEMLRECAGRLGGEIAARRAVAWVVDEEFGGLAEITAVVG
jgi:AcrR family transcriptional regulator